MPDKKIRSIGIDISDHTIEVIELEKNGSDTRITAAGRIALAPGIVEAGRIKDRAALKTSLAGVLKAAKLDPSAAASRIFGLPETLVYIHIFSPAPDDRNNVKEAVARELETIIPYKKSELFYAYKAIDNNLPAPAAARMLTVAVLKSDISQWHDFFRSAGINITLFDIESLALFRGMWREYPAEPVCLVDIGAVTSLVSIFTPLGLTYSCSIRSAGNDITEKLSRELGVSYAAAEELKIGSGLKTNDRYPAAAAVIKGVLTEIFAEVKKNIAYFGRKYDFLPVKNIVVAGGTGNLPGLAEYLESLALGINIRLGLPLYRNDETGSEYIEALGLALRGTSAGWDKTDPFIPVSESGGKAPARHRYRLIGEWFKAPERRRYRLIGEWFIAKKFRIIAAGVLSGLIILSLLIIFFAPGKKDLPVPSEAAAPVIPAPAAISAPAAVSATEAKEAPERKVIIKSLSSSLNIRSGPGTDYGVIGTAGPRAEYPLLDETNGWRKIGLSGDKTGWVFAEYTEKVE